MALTPGLDFDGQVVAITGAGRGIGREYALLLARLGARVVVNDLGTGVTGEGSDLTVAGDVAAEICARGGQAVADGSDVSTMAGGAGVVEAALVAFGRLDGVIHNAGTQHVAPYPDMPAEAVRHILATHLLGAFHVGQPAWRVMAAQGYGRIVLTASVGMLGAPNLSAYAAAKAGCVGLARSMAIEAEAAGLDIKVNAIAPTATTRRSRTTHAEGSAAAELDARFGDLMDPSRVAPVGAYLVSRECALNGECIKAGGAVTARIVFGMTRGWAEGAEVPTPADVGRHLDEIMRLDGLAFPTSSAHARELVLQRAEHHEGQA